MKAGTDCFVLRPRNDGKSKQMLKVGFLLNSLQVQAWEYELIHQIQHSSFAQIELVVLNASPKTASSAPKLYRLYRKLDRKLFTTKPDAFETKTLDFLDEGIKLLEVKPIQREFTDQFSDKSLQEIKGSGLDVIIRLGFRILKGQILSAAKLGVWSFHHGDPTFYRGGPPAFWEVMLGKPISGLVLIQLTEKLDQGKILYQSFAQTNPLSVQRNANAVFWKSAYIIPRVMRQIEGLGISQWLSQFAQIPSTEKSQLLRPPKGFQTLRLVSKLLLRNSKRKWQENRIKPHWQVGYMEKSTWNFEKGVLWKDLTLIPNKESKSTYCADPFPIQIGTETEVLVESFDNKKQKGCICLIDDKGNKRVVLQENWHLSYPFIWEESHKTYLIPESADAGCIYRYAFDSGSTQLQQREILFDEEAFDPTIWKNESGYWLFVNQKKNRAISAFDELFLYHSESWENPKWVPHPQNPIVSDVRKSRPAGKLFIHQGKLYRPAQDSGLRYGNKIQVMEIIQLNPKNYEEKLAYTLEAPQEAGILGMHTINFSKDRVYLDFYSRR